MKIKIFSKLPIEINWRNATMLLIIIQSCGIRFFEGQGTVLAVVILALLADSVKYVTNRDIKILVGLFLYIGFEKLINPDFHFSRAIFEFVLIIEAFLLLVRYRRIGKKGFLNDFYNTLTLIFINALIGYALFWVIPAAFVFTVAFKYPYREFLYFFYVTDHADGAFRNNGLMWEPGILQLMLNIYLFYSIRLKKPALLIFLIIIVIISCFSTTGFITLGINYALYIYTNFKENKRLVIVLIILTVFSSGYLFFLVNNIQDKLGGENTSGLARYRDFFIGMELIKEKPIFGHGLYDDDYLVSKQYVSRIEETLFTSGYIESVDTLAGGYTNGLLGFFSWFGIPMGILTFIALYKNALVGDNKIERIAFFIIICFTLTSEPITYTSFFLLFPLSTLVFLKKKLTNPVIKVPQIQNSI